MGQTKTYWKWFYVVACILSVIDYIDHITKAAIFYENKVDWFLFTLSSTTALIGCIALTNAAFLRIIKTENILLQSLAIISGVTFHIYVSGPISNRVFFPQSILMFHWNIIMLAIALGVFYIVRLLVYFVNNRMATQR